MAVAILAQVNYLIDCEFETRSFPVPRAHWDKFFARVRSPDKVCLLSAEQPSVAILAQGSCSAFTKPDEILFKKIFNGND